MAEDRYELARTIIGLIEKELETAGFELLDVRVFRGGGRLQLRVYVDTPGGIDLQGVTKASRTVSMLLEEADPIVERYVIEVSSPGVRRPLRKRDHYAAQLGENVELKLLGAERGQKLRARLVAADEEELRVVPVLPEGAEEGAEPDERSISYARVLEANLDPEFDAAALIREDRRHRKEEKRRDRARRKTAKGRRRPKK